MSEPLTRAQAVELLRSLSYYPEFMNYPVEDVATLVAFVAARECAVWEAAARVCEYVNAYTRDDIEEHFGVALSAKHPFLDLAKIMRQQATKEPPRKVASLTNDQARCTQLEEAAEMLWVTVANVSAGDWTTQTPEWQEAAARCRDQYFAAIATTREG